MSPFARYYQRAKNVLHAIQALAIFIAWALTIAILSKAGKSDGRVWYCFALVGNSQGTHFPKQVANLTVVLVLHTCSHLPDGFSCFSTHTPLFECLRPRYH